MKEYYENAFKTIKKRYNINSNEDIDFYEMEQEFFDLFNYFEIFEEVFDKIEDIVKDKIEVCEAALLYPEGIIARPHTFLRLWERNLKNIQSTIEKGKEKYEGIYFKICTLFFIKSLTMESNFAIMFSR